MSPLPRTDRMTRALGALTGLDDKLQAVVGYLTDPLGSPVPAVEDRLRLVRAVHDALPTTPDLVLVLTSLSTDRAQAVRRAAVQALEDTDLALGQGPAAEAQPAAGRQGPAALGSQGLGAALRVAPLTRAAEALAHLLRREGGQEVLTHLGAERPDLMALADELRGRERALAVVPEGAPVPLPPVTPLPGPGAAPEASAEPEASAALAADELRRALGWGPGATGATNGPGTTDGPGTPGKAARQVGDADLDAFVAVAEGRADQLPASVLALGARWVAHQVPSLGLTHLTRLFLAWGERLEWSLLASRLTWDADPRAVQDALERGGLPPSQAQEVVTSWVLYDAGPEATWPWILQNPDLALRALGEDWFSARAVLRALTYAPSLPAVLLPALAQAAVGRSEGNRALAQRLLARSPAAAELALQALGSPQAATRRAGAAWLADLGLPGGTERLRAAWAAEGDQLVRGDILRALVAYGDDVTDIVAPEALAVPARRPRVPVALTWFPFETLPAVRLTDGTALDADAVRRWVLLAHGLKDPDGRGTVAAYLSLLDPRSARELSAVVVESWIARNRELGKGESLRTKGLLAFAVGMDGARLAADARSALRRNAAWRVESETVLTAVAANRAPEALQVVLAAAADHRLPRVRDAARSLAEAAATERGWSPAELGDRSIPTVGFSDDGLLHLSYGDREFLGRLTPELTIGLADADGRPRKTLPPPRKSEDRELVAETRARLASARKELRAVLGAQGRRLYEAMCAGRAWPLAQWRELLAVHPLVRHLVARLVWLASDGQDDPGPGAPDNGPARLRAFRPTEDGELLGADDDAVDLPPRAVIRLAHATLLTDAEMAAWRAHLFDYEVEPLFDQLSARGPGFAAGQTVLRDGAGRRAVARELRRAAESRGYERASTRYRYSEFSKDFPTLGLRSIIDFAGADAWDEGEDTATGGLCLRRGRREVPLAQVPPVLLAECYADYRAVTDAAWDTGAGVAS